MFFSNEFYPKLVFSNPFVRDEVSFWCATLRLTHPHAIIKLKDIPTSIFAESYRIIA
jgi:hypothetical protein